MDEEETQYLNQYECPTCGHEWSDVWSSTSNDDCPNCGERHIEPKASFDLSEPHEETIGRLTQDVDALEGEVAALLAEARTAQKRVDRLARNMVIFAVVVVLLAMVNFYIATQAAFCARDYGQFLNLPSRFSLGNGCEIHKPFGGWTSVDKKGAD